MKNTGFQIALILAVIFSLAFTTGETKDYILKKGDSLAFSNKGGKSHYSQSSKGANDGSGFKLIDSNGYCRVWKITRSTGASQDELLIQGCTGSLTKRKNDLLIQFEKTATSYFLLNLDSQAIVGKFDTIRQLVLRAVTMNGKEGEFYCGELSNKNTKTTSFTRDSAGNKVLLPENKTEVHKIINLKTVPGSVLYDELYAQEHKEHTLAFFSEFSVTIEGGQVLHFPSGHYILFEGNTMTVEVNEE